jgi:anaerobic ribonucleoside-triphosphate reductase
MSNQNNQNILAKLKETNHLEIINENENSFVVLNKNTEKKYELKKATLNNNNWENLSKVLDGREPIILDGITRIVGYFSKISNWNKSKIGELHDRRQGNYKVGECDCN